MISYNYPNPNLNLKGELTVYSDQFNGQLLLHAGHVGSGLML